LYPSDAPWVYLRLLIDLTNTDRLFIRRDAVVKKGNVT
jgi:hypothetical protein